MRLILSAILMLVAVSAQAVTVSADIGSRRDSITSKYNRVTVIGMQDEKLGVKLTSGPEDRIEADYTLKPLNLSWFDVKAGLGVVTEGTAHYTYAVTPEVTVPVFGGVTAKASWQYRNDVKNTIADQSRTWALGLDYGVTKDLSVGAKFENAKGDQNFKSASLGASYKF